MSSGKATIRSTAKHERRNIQDRRMIKKWLLTGNNFEILVNTINMKSKGYKVCDIDKYSSGIGIRIDRFMKMHGFHYFTLWPKLSMCGPFINIIKPYKFVGDFLRLLKIDFNMNSVLNYEIVRSQSIEPKPVKPRFPKPVEVYASVKTVGEQFFETDNDQAIRLMTDIRQLDKDRLHAEIALDGIEKKLQQAKDNLKYLMADYL